MRTRLAHFKACWQSARSHWLFVLMAILLTAYAAWTTFEPAFADVPDWARPEKWPKLQFHSVLVLVLLGLTWVLVEGSYRLNRGAKSLEISLDDPKVYFSFVDKRRDMHPRTPFSLRNRGGGIAHRIQIEPVKLGAGTATFKQLDFLDSETPMEVIPVVENANFIVKHNLLNLLQHEINNTGFIENGFTVPIRATYTNYSGKRKFATRCDFVFFNITDALHKDGVTPEQIRPRYEIKNTHFEVLESRI